MVTIKDVAKHSGFSVATVSAVINGVPIVSEHAKKKIEESIKALDYKPNMIARSLKSSKSLSIGIIVNNIINPLYPEMIFGIEKVAWKNNYEVFLCNTEGEFNREQKYISNLIGKQVDGVIIATAEDGSKIDYTQFANSNIPYVFINRKPLNFTEKDFFVGVDNYLAGRKVIDYLKQFGYKKIGFVSGPKFYFTFRERYRGVFEGAQEANMELKEEWLLFGDRNYSEATGYEYMQKLLSSGHVPDVIICASDLLAFGVFKALLDNNKMAPQDVVLISMDNNRFSDLIGLSSVDLKPKLMGEKAAEVLIKKIKNNSFVEHEKNELLLEPIIVPRETCGIKQIKNLDKK